jgi:hypothetical protein
VLEHALQHDEHPTYEDLGAPAALLPAYARRILNQVGLQGFHWSVTNRERRTLSNEQLTNVADFGLNVKDTAYFLDVPVPFVAKRFSKIQYRPAAQGPLAYLRTRPVTKVSHWLASKIYEALDADFTKGETAQLLEVSPKAVDYVLYHSEIANTIAVVLRYLALLNKGL